MNAVLLKELRQSVRNRYVLAAYLIFIVVLLTVAGTQISSAVSAARDGPYSLFYAGRTFFLTLHGIFAVLGICFIPAYVLIRIVRERWWTDIDLAYVTPMPPSALLLGKFGSALAMTGLFLSAVLPFLALSYFIGGIDVLTITVSVILTLELVAILTLGAILLAIAPMPKILRGVAVLGYAALLWILASGWKENTSAPSSDGYMSVFAERDSCILLVEIMLVGLSAAGLLYAGALAGFCSVNVDRMRPFRILATALFAGWGIVSAFQSRLAYFKEMPQVWAILFMLFAAGMLVVGLSERTEPGTYLLQRRPRARVWRVLGYPFRTGQFNAVCWSALLLAIGIALSYVIFPAAETLTEWCSECRGKHPFPCNAAGGEPVLIFTLNISGYALTMLALWHYSLRSRRVPCAALWWVTGLIIVLSSVIFISLNESGVKGVNYCIGNLFAEKREVLPWLYGWNAFALASLIPAVVVHFRRIRE